MFIKRIYITIILSVLLSSMAVAQVQFESFEQLWEMTVKQNPTLATYRLNIKIAKDNYRASKSFLLPSISASASGQDNLKLQQTVVGGSLAGQAEETLTLGSRYSYSAGLTGNYTLFNWQTITESRQAKNAVQLQESQEAYYLQTLKNMAASLYYQTLVSLKALEITRKDLAFSDTLVHLATEKYAEGSISLIDLNQSKINYNQIAQNAIASENLYEGNISQLKILLGLQVDDTIIINERLPEKIETTDFQLGKNKQLDTYARMVKDAEYTFKVQKSVNIPVLSFFAYYGGDQFQNKLKAFSFKSSQWHRQEYIGLSLSASLFSGLYDLNKMKAAGKNVELAQTQLEIAAQESAINDRLLLDEIVRNGASTQKASEAFFLYRENLNLYHIQYSEGVIALNTFLVYFQNYLITENAYFTQLSNYYNNLSVVISRNDIFTK